MAFGRADVGEVIPELPTSGASAPKQAGVVRRELGFRSVGEKGADMSTATP